MHVLINGSVRAQLVYSTDAHSWVIRWWRLQHWVFLLLFIDVMGILEVFMKTGTIYVSLLADLLVLWSIHHIMTQNNWNSLWLVPGGPCAWKEFKDCQHYSRSHCSLESMKMSTRPIAWILFLSLRRRMSMTSMIPQQFRYIITCQSQWVELCPPATCPIMLCRRWLLVVILNASRSRSALSLLHLFECFHRGPL